MVLANAVSVWDCVHRMECPDLEGGGLVYCEDSERLAVALETTGRQVLEGNIKLDVVKQTTTSVALTLRTRDEAGIPHWRIKRIRDLMRDRGYRLPLITQRGGALLLQFVKVEGGETP